MLRHLLFIGFLSLMLAGCRAPRAVEKKLYLIQLPEQSDTIFPQAAPLLDGLCLINEVSVNPVYANRQIAIRDQSHQIQYFDNHQWAVRPPDLLSHVLVDFFSRQGLFQQVGVRFWGKTPDYAITTHVSQLEAENIDQTFKVRLKMNLTLEDLRNNKIVIDQRINREAILKQKDINMMASTISSLLNQELKTFALEIKNQLSPEGATQP